jgi:hypothetical protein
MRSASVFWISAIVQMLVVYLNEIRNAGVEGASVKSGVLDVNIALKQTIGYMTCT